MTYSYDALKKKDAELLPDKSLSKLFTTIGELLKKGQMKILLLDQFRVNSSDLANQLY